jgi:hypothetical protein
VGIIGLERNEGEEGKSKKEEKEKQGFPRRGIEPRSRL